MSSVGDVLKIGDMVSWRGGWGEQAPKLARVVGITRTTEPRTKYGRPVDSVPWFNVRLNLVVVDLDNGHWAYGNQIDRPMEDPAVVSVVVDGLAADCGVRS